MAKYTTTIKSIIDSGINIFDFSYPIFDPNYKSVLETKILNRYLFREIGLETVALFKHFLAMKMNEIMPYYNKHYLANKVFETYDPYKNKDFMIEDSRTSTGDNSSQNDGTTSSHNDGSGKTIFQDTPTSKLGTTDYATNITDNTDSNDQETTSHGSTSSEFTTTEEYTSHLHGHDGMKYPADILMNVRETFNNIDVEIIEELNDLFMGVY